MTRIAVEPAMFRWARERARLDADWLYSRFPALTAWEGGTRQPTLKQLESFARATHVPIGYLFLREPPVEGIPIPDYRTVGGAGLAKPSPNLLETVYICEQRQEWFRDFVRAQGEAPLPFVSSLTIRTDIVSAAAAIRSALRFDPELRRDMPTWSDALREFMNRADDLGILVMCSGIVGSNTRRKLDPMEFRGFALADPYAPVIFVNGADTRSAQMFTLAHELAHIWLGQSALSDADAATVSERAVEHWCNAVAAELLVPMQALRNVFRHDTDLAADTQRLARFFKVGTLVILRRLFDLGQLTRAEFRGAYAAELARLSALPSGSGGNFYRTLPVRVSKRFARALVSSTLEGQTLYRDALRMLGFAKMRTFDQLGRSLGVTL